MDTGGWQIYIAAGATSINVDLSKFFTCVNDVVDKFAENFLSNRNDAYGTVGCLMEGDS
jgi:hypothetical protein